LPAEWMGDAVQDALPGVQVRVSLWSAQLGVAWKAYAAACGRADQR
jgi:hypothetical protein